MPWFTTYVFLDWDCQGKEEKQKKKTLFVPVQFSCPVFFVSHYIINMNDDLFT